MGYFILFFMLSVGFILGGLYRVRLTVLWASDVSRISIRILAWHKLFGYVWTGNEGAGRSGWILVNRLFARKKRIRADRLVKQKKAKGAGKRFRMLCLIRQSLPRVPEWLYRFIRLIHFDKCVMEGSMGFKDPAKTGVFFGIMQACDAMMGDRWNVDIVPVFTGVESDGSLKMEFRFFLMPLLWVGICTGFRFGIILWRCRS